MLWSVVFGPSPFSGTASSVCLRSWSLATELCGLQFPGQVMNLSHDSFFSPLWPSVLAAAPSLPPLEAAWAADIDELLTYRFGKRAAC